MAILLTAMHKKEFEKDHLYLKYLRKYWVKVKILTKRKILKR